MVFSHGAIALFLRFKREIGAGNGCMRREPLEKCAVGGREPHLKLVYRYSMLQGGEKAQARVYSVTLGSF
jgi:hypothetical protein